MFYTWCQIKPEATGLFYCPQHIGISLFQLNCLQNVFSLKKINIDWKIKIEVFWEFLSTKELEVGVPAGKSALC